jgi:hypothetical protein
MPVMAFIVAALAAFLMPAVRPDPVDAQATLNSQATLTVLTSPVDVQRASGNRDTASSGNTLVVGDRVFTGAGGTAKLTFFQGTEVDIAPDTELMVQEMTQRASGASTVSFGQAIGSTVAKVASLFNPASRVQVSTQSAVAVVRGTELEVTVTKEQIQVFRSNTGSFDVIAGGQIQRVKDGEVTVVPPPPPPAPPPTTRDTKTVGDATVSLPSGNDRPPLPPVPVAEIGKLFEKVTEISAKDGPRVVATPPVAARDLIDVARGKPVELRPLGAKAKPPAEAQTSPSLALRATPVPVKLPAATPRAKATPDSRQSLNDDTVTTPPTGTPVCEGPASTSTPTASQFGVAGQVVDGSGSALHCVVVKVGQYGGPISGTTYSDKSGTFRVFIDTPKSGASTGTFAIFASDSSHTQQTVPTIAASAGKLATLSSPVILRANDATVTGSIWSGARATPATGAIASVAVAVPTPSGSNSTLTIYVAATPVTSTGAFNISLASGVYAYFVASQDNVSTYAQRSVSVAMPAVVASPLTNSPIDVVLPTLDVSSPLTCDRLGAPCTVTVSGKAWTSTGAVDVGVVDTGGNYHSFGNVTPKSGDFANQTLVSSEPVWPSGTYTIVANQGTGVAARYVKLATPFTVPDSKTTSCTVSNATAKPSAAQIKLTGVVTDSAGALLENACAKVTRVDPYGATSGYALTGENGAFSVIVDGGAGDFEVLVTKSGYTPQVVPVVHADAGVVTDITTIMQGQVIPLALNTTTVSGTVTSGVSSGAVGSGTTVGIAVSASWINRSGSPYPVYVSTAQPSTSGAYTLGIANAASGTYRIGVMQSGIDGYSSRSYQAPLGPVSGAVTRAITLPTLSASASCSTASQLCSVVLTGTGWLSGSVVTARATSSAATIEFSPPIMPASDGSFTSQSVSGTRHVGTGDFLINASQDGPNGETIVVVAPSGLSGKYSVSSVGAQAVVAPPAPTPLATTVPPASPTVVLTVVATPSTSTGTPVPTTTVAATVVPAVTPMVSATPTP